MVLVLLLLLQTSQPGQPLSLSQNHTDLEPRYQGKEGEHPPR